MKTGKKIYEEQSAMFNHIGGNFIEIKDYGRETITLSVEELYQHFKDRFLLELIKEKSSD